MNQPGPKPNEAAAAPPPLWEWMLAGVGLLLVLACMGYLGFNALQGEPGPPDPVVELVQVRESGGGFLAQVRVRNRSRATAEGLVVAGELREGGQVVERTEVEFEFLPAESWREAGLFFRRDPRRGELRLVPVSYRKP